jgi:hypothetical protein
MTAPFQAFLQRCVSLDLEVDPATPTIFAFAAVRDGFSFPHPGKEAQSHGGP